MSVTIPLKKMSFKEKIQAMELIWDDICHEGTIKSPSWHEDILINREQAIKDGTDKFIDWETAKTNILKEIK